MEGSSVHADPAGGIVIERGPLRRTGSAALQMKPHGSIVVVVIASRGRSITDVKGQRDLNADGHEN
jgi:hypothetical protein